MRNINLLDCTLRDGSYPINYAFSLEDNELIVKALERSGVAWIEVGGHGMGLGASGCTNGMSTHSDLEHIIRAKKSICAANIGVFATPGIATAPLLKEAIEVGIDFVRVGVDVDKIERAHDLLLQSKEANRFTFLNLMKSYALNPHELVARLGNIVETELVDVICIVDSAGTMLPNQVTDYVKIMLSETNQSIGFHGHNNLQMAVANSLSAVAAGATFVDATLRGMGRSSGNAQIDVLATVLEKQGMHTLVDGETLSLFCDFFFDQNYPKYGIRALELFCGKYGLHSSFLPEIMEYCEKREIDAIKAIAKITAKDRINLDLNLLDKDSNSYEQRLSESGLSALVLENIRKPDSFPKLIEHMRAMGIKYGLETCLTFSPMRSESMRLLPVTISNDLIIGHVECGSDELIRLTTDCKGVEFLGFDLSLLGKSSASLFENPRNFVYEEQIFEYFHIQALATFLASSKSVDVYSDRKFLFGESPIQLFASWPLNAEKRDLCIIDKQMTSTTELERIEKRYNHVLFVSQDSFPPGFLSYKGEVTNLLRLDSRAYFDLYILGLVKLLKSLPPVNGPVSMGDFNIVSNGMLGAKGDVVVDNVKHPYRILGIASGHGDILETNLSAEYSGRFVKVAQSILKATTQKIMRES